MTSEGFPTQFVKSAKFDYNFRILNISLYDNKDLNKWVENFKRNKDIVLKFTVHDAKGNVIAGHDFSVLTIISDTAFFDYTNNDLSVRNLALHYKSVV